MVEGSVLFNLNMTELSELKRIISVKWLGWVEVGLCQQLIFE